MEAPKFQVVVQGSSISPQDWLRAMKAPASELPKLSGEQKKVARGVSASGEEYARGELARLHGKERVAQQGRQLGEVVRQFLEPLGSEYRLVGVTSQMTKLRWVLTVETPNGEANVFVARELADDVLDWGPRDKVEELKSRLLYGLGLEETAARLCQ